MVPLVEVFEVVIVVLIVGLVDVIIVELIGFVVVPNDYTLCFIFSKKNIILKKLYFTKEMII